MAINMGQEIWISDIGVGLTLAALVIIFQV